MDFLQKLMLLEELKTQDLFTIDAFEDRAYKFPGKDVVQQMKLEILDFTNFLIIQLNNQEENLKEKIIAYFKNWDTEYFEQEEIEFIMEINEYAISISGVNPDEIIV
jgi:hypothetical protein